MAMMIERMMRVKLAKSNMEKVFLGKTLIIIHFYILKSIYNNINRLFYNKII